MGERYYKDPAFKNTFYASAIAAEKLHADMFFPGDAGRTIVASNAFAFRERSKGKAWNDLMLPFMNYRMRGSRGYPEENPYQHFNQSIATKGLWIEELGEKVPLIPVVFEFEATFFSSEGRDLDYAYNLLLAKKASQPELPVSLSVSKGSTVYDFLIPARIMWTGVQYEPTYTEADWLRQNKIRSFSMDFEVRTMAIPPAQVDADFWIPEKVIFDFAAQRNLGDSTNSYEETLELVIDHLNGTVEEQP